MFGATTTAVFAEILGYDAAAMNAAIDLGYEKEFQACLVNSDKYRGPHPFMLAPDNAWEIGKAVVDNSESLYARGKAAAVKCGELMLADPKLKLTAYEKDSLEGYMKDLEKLPAKEGDFIDMCLKKYAGVKGFNPAAYGL
jgi:methanol--5-hydroxybenzimidazolylcobamide Co-methyltransferase